MRSFFQAFGKGKPGGCACNRRLFLGWLAAGGLQAACGYRVASRNRRSLPIQTLAVEPLRNETTTFQVEQFLTRALARTFVEKTPYAVVSDPKQADAVLQGSVFHLTASPVTFGQATFGSTFLVTLQARVELKDSRSGEVFFRNDNYVFREQYVINVDVQNFFTELNPALERIADDFSNSVVTTILETF